MIVAILTALTLGFIVFAALAVRAAAIWCVIQIGLTVLSTHQISFWQAFAVSAMLLLASYDLTGLLRRDTNQ